MNNVSPGFPTQPFAAMLELTTTTSEMLFASRKVIAHRTERMLKPGPKTADDNREFELMGSEKILAAADASKSMVSLWMTMWNDLAARMMSAPENVTTSLSSLAASRTPEEAATHKMNLSSALNHFPMSPARLASDALKLMERGLAPFHSTVLANAKRLRSS